MSFTSSATTEEGVLRDWYRSAVSSYAERGLIPAGTIGEIPESEGPVTAERVITRLGTHFREQSLAQGGAAMDANNAPVQQTYRERRYQFIAAQEAVRTRSYDDATGRPVPPGGRRIGNVSIGIGFNMERRDARDIFRQLYGTSVSFDDVYAGRTALTEEQVGKLFDYNASEVDQFLARRFPGVAFTEHQRIALTSLGFTGPAIFGRNITDAIKRGDWNAARDEILYRSNRSRNRGIANRRYREAQMFAGPMSAGSMPAHADYIKDYLPSVPGRPIT